MWRDAAAPKQSLGNEPSLVSVRSMSAGHDILFLRQPLEAASSNVDLLREQSSTLEQLRQALHAVVLVRSAMLNGRAGERLLPSAPPSPPLPAV